MMKPRATKSRLSAARLRGLKSLARKIDSEEAVSIRLRGRAAFARHEQLREIVRALKAHRLRAGISLSDVARRSGIAKPNLSRLENSEHTVPTLDTLDRYARAIGMTVELNIAPARAA